MEEDERPEPPDLPAWEETPWRAWTELTDDRHYVTVGVSIPMGGVIIQAKPMAIPWTAIQVWCDRANLGAEDRAFVAPLVNSIDREYLRHCARQQAHPGGRPQTLADKLARWDEAEA